MKFYIKLICILVFSFVSGSVFAEEGTNDTIKVKAEVIDINKKAFLEKIFNYEKSPDKWLYEGDSPCIVSFYADYCPPCRKMQPLLRELAGVYTDQLSIYRINIQNEKELAAVFGIQSIPTTLFIPVKGQPQGVLGAIPKNELQEIIETYLLKKEEDNEK